MATEEKRTEAPPYPSYVTFTNFIKGLREAGIPSRIDKHVLGKLSGSAQAALTAALKWMGLIDEAGVPTLKLNALVGAGESQYSGQLKSVLQDSYAFLSDGTLDLQKGTGAQLEVKFREYGISGSTVAKCIGFFLQAAKDAGIALGPYMKAPKTYSSNGSRKKARRTAQTIGTGEEPEEDATDHEIPDAVDGFVKIHIPLHGMSDGVVFLPDNLTSAQWQYALRITKFLLENYRMDGPNTQKENDQ